MKTCPHCHIQVGGSAQYCPLCQNPLVGTPEPDRYPKVVPPARQTSLFYRIAAFVLLGAAVICGVVDYIMIEGRHMHWSLLVLIGAVGVLMLLRALLRQGRNAPKLLFQILIGTSLIVTFADYYAGWNGIAIDAIVPILCSVTLVLNFIFAFVNRRFTENGLVYLLLNIVVGVVPYIGLTLRHSVRPPMAWVICLVISMITFWGWSSSRAAVCWQSLKNACTCKSEVIRSGKGGQVNDKKIAIVPYVTNGRNSQVGHDGHFNIFKKREVLY